MYDGGGGGGGELLMSIRSIGMEIPECIWGVGYKRLEGGTWKGRVEVHAIGYMGGF